MKAYKQSEIPSDLVRRTVFASEVGISDKLLQRAAKAGELSQFKMGDARNARVFVSRESATAWLQGQMKPVEAE